MRDFWPSATERALSAPERSADDVALNQKGRRFFAGLDEWPFPSPKGVDPSARGPFFPVLSLTTGRGRSGPGRRALRGAAPQRSQGSRGEPLTERTAAGYAGPRAGQSSQSPPAALSPSRATHRFGRAAKRHAVDGSGRNAARCRSSGVPTSVPNPKYAVGLSRKERKEPKDRGLGAIARSPVASSRRDIQGDDLGSGSSLCDLCVLCGSIAECRPTPTASFRWTGSRANSRRPRRDPRRASLGHPESSTSVNACPGSAPACGSRPGTLRSAA